MNIWKEKQQEKPEKQIDHMDIDRFMQTLADLIFKTLNERDCSIEKLAKDCNMSGREISFILCGKRKEIRFSTVIKISKGLGMQTSLLVENLEKEAALIHS